MTDSLVDKRLGAQLETIRYAKYEFCVITYGGRISNQIKYQNDYHLKTVSKNHLICIY